MSVVVGIKQNGKVYLGCDTQTTCGQLKHYDAARPKIFRKDNMLIGAVGLVRTSQVIQLGFTTPKRFEEEDDRQYMYRWCTSLKKYLKKEEELSSDGPYMNNQLLIGYNGVLYLITSFFSFNTFEEYAIGAGDELSIGSLNVSKGTPRRRITKAVKAAQDNSIYVGGKILIESI